MKTELSKQGKANASTDQIAELTAELTHKMNEAIAEISHVNTQTRLLSLNAQIEAARAGGEVGAAFAVVAKAIQDLSKQTATVADNMSTETQGSIDQLNEVNKNMSTNVRGLRLSDLSLTNIDLIDRNLYERTCDVRWWATDPSLVHALTDQSDESIRYACERLGVILNAYTVYYDLVLADLQGNIIANGKPNLYRSQGTNVSQAQWFSSAMATGNGDEYGFETCHASDLVDQQRVLVYSCAVRENGSAHGQPLGVLGVLFNWDDLAQVIVKHTPLSKDEWANARVCIVDDKCNILADSRDNQLNETLAISTKKVFAEKKGFVIDRYNGKSAFIAHALSPGYETYATGWHSIVLQTL